MARSSSLLVSKKLLVGLSLLALSSLGTAVVGTFAWFEIEGGAEVSNIQIEFADGFTLEVGLKDQDNEIHYFASLNDATLRQYIPGFTSFAPLKEASSMYSSTWLNDGFDYRNGYPTLYGPYYEAGGSTGITLPLSEGFFQLETYFRSNDDVYLFLDPECEITAMESINRTREEQLGLPSGQLDEVTKVARISFLSEEGYTIFAPGTHQKASFAGPLDIDGDGYYDYSEGKEILYGEYSGSPQYLPPNETPPSGEGTSFSAGHASGVQILDTSSYVPAVENCYFLDDLALPLNVGSYDPSLHPLALLRANTPTRVLLTFYVEGWDPHSTEKIEYGAWSVNLGFSALQFR